MKRSILGMLFITTILFIIGCCGNANAQTVYTDDDFIQGIVISCSDSLISVWKPWPDSVPTDSMINYFGPANQDTIWLTSIANMDLYDIDGMYQGTTSNFVPYEVYFKAYRWVDERSQYYYGPVSEVLRFEVTVLPIPEVTIDTVLVD